MELPIVCTYKKIRNKYSSTNKIEDTIMVRYEDYMTENFTGISVKKRNTIYYLYTKNFTQDIDRNKPILAAQEFIDF